jgi:hypothetical protein
VLSPVACFVEREIEQRDEADALSRKIVEARDRGRDARADPKSILDDRMTAKRFLGDLDEICHDVDRGRQAAERL